MITKIYEYAHEYQMDTVLLETEGILCKQVTNAIIFLPGGCLYPEIERTISLLLFAEKYSMSKLMSTVVKELSFLPSNYLRLVSSYQDLTSNLKLMISDKRLDKFDNNKYLKDYNNPP